MYKRETLSLKKPPDPAKIAQSLQIGLRFVDRKGRYILQKYVKVVAYELGGNMAGEKYDSINEHRTWVDIPLVPETYEAQA
jgi:hypothetical protein